MRSLHIIVGSFSIKVYKIKMSLHFYGLNLYYYFDKKYFIKIIKIIDLEDINRIPTNIWDLNIYLVKYLLLFLRKKIISVSLINEESRA